MMLGRGDGTFDGEIACGLALGSNLSSNVIADFNHDRKVDLAVREVGIFFGMNGCNFTTLVSAFDGLSSGRLADPLGVADFNGDGHADLVTGEIAVLLGDGRGGFSSASTFPIAGLQEGVFYLMGDLNNDTKLDLIIIRSDSWQVLLNSCP